MGPFEARYLAFLETISQIRPRLHRYCARMTGSVLDGEDIVQDALFEAYRKLDQFDDTRPGCFASRTTDASTFCVTVVQEEKPRQMLPRPKRRCQLSPRFWESKRLLSIWY
jgi:hypothetical protein